MGMYGIVCIAVVFYLANGQTTLPPPVCTQDNKMEAGGWDYECHNAFLNFYFRCVHGIVYTYQCPLGTECDATTKRCIANCEGRCGPYTCDMSANNTNFRAACAEEYYKCINGMFMKYTCPPGQYYNPTSRSCESGVGVDDKLCLRSNGSAPGTCNLKPHTYGDNCKFESMANNITTVQECAEETSFNASACGCTILDKDCPKPTANSRNRMPDPECRYTFSIQPTKVKANGEPQPYSERINDNLNDSIIINGGTFSQGTASLSTTGGVLPYIYIYMFNNKQPVKHFGFCIVLRASSPTATPFQAVVNTFEGACSPTLELNVTRSGSTYNVIANVMGMTVNGPKNTTYMASSVSASITLQNSENMLSICFFHVDVLTLKLTDKGSAGTGNIGSPVVVRGNTPAGSTPSFNTCGFSLGRGLNGFISAFYLWDGCTNATMLTNK